MDWGIGLLTLAAAIVGLVAAIISLRAASRSHEPKNPPTIMAPVDADTLRYIERTVWERPTTTIPAAYDAPRPPVVVVANMKGGVAKTTICANLAAHYASTLGRRVLLIDFDYQGSLTQTILGHMGVTEAQMSSHHLLIGTKHPEDAINFAPPMKLRANDAGQVRLFRAHYPLATVENELMADWLANKIPEVRYQLLRYLTSDQFRREFDICFIDCPPRITTGTINALTSATHLLIPSQPDGLSLPAAEYFSLQLKRMRPHVFPRLKLLGLVPSLTHQATQLTDGDGGENAVLDEFTQSFKRIWDDPSDPKDPVWKDCFVPRTRPIRDAAGKAIAYLRNANAKSIFKRLGDKLEQRLK
jgi:cellulose biosynthesis protein BcsQ